MGSISETLATSTTTTMMLKLVLLLSVASLGSALNCEECIREMHSLSFLIKQASPDIMSYLTANYCPGLEGHEEQCENDLTKNYVQMLFMIVQHFFVDGAQHVCEAWDFCPVPQDSIIPEPHPYTCEECVEGLEVVGAYMTDPLWIAEYTLYLEQNFCVGHPDRCVEAVKTHFPPMHAMVVEEFWKPMELCAGQEVFGATKPPQ